MSLLTGLISLTLTGKENLHKDSDKIKIFSFSRYDISFFTTSKSELDIVDLTSDFFILESIHRLVVCGFEALCLHRGFGGRPGGATPGKYIMGLRVVSCHQVRDQYTK